MSIKPWISALKVPQTTYEAWAKMHTQNESTLFWCLLNDKISSEEYFSWAKEHYGLAFLNNDFFKQEPQHALWKKISSVANWSPECLPVFEWDGVIFIACVEPQIDVRWSFKVQYVLADAVDLKMHWLNLNDGG